MRHVILVLSFLLIGGSFSSLPTLAQSGELEREAVCVNLGGDALSLDIWDAAEIADFEASTGDRSRERIPPPAPASIPPA